MEPKLVAALAVPSILLRVLELEKQLWVCRSCDGKTSMLSEQCVKCGREDLEQGSKT